jgi:mono/diheme cytochrome c family protein
MTRTTLLKGTVAILVLLVFGILAIKVRGFRASDTPTAAEVQVARLVRNVAIPAAERLRQNPYAHSEPALEQGREQFLRRCAVCHGHDGGGSTAVGAHVYPRVPNLHDQPTQRLTDGELRYIIEHGVQLTAMAAAAGAERETLSWSLVGFVRTMASATPEENRAAAGDRQPGRLRGPARLRALSRGPGPCVKELVRAPGFEPGTPAV